MYGIIPPIGSVTGFDSSRDVLCASRELPFARLRPYNRCFGFVDIVISFKIKSGCDWPYNYDECRCYLKVPTSTCNS